MAQGHMSAFPRVVHHPAERVAVSSWRGESGFTKWHIDRPEVGVAFGDCNTYCGNALVDNDLAVCLLSAQYEENREEATRLRWAKLYGRPIAGYAPRSTRTVRILTEDICRSCRRAFVLELAEAHNLSQLSADGEISREILALLEIDAVGRSR